MKTLVISLPCEVTPDLISRVVEVFHEYTAEHQQVLTDVHVLAFSEIAPAPEEVVDPVEVPFSGCSVCGDGPCQCSATDELPFAAKNAEVAAQTLDLALQPNQTELPPQIAVPEPAKLVKILTLSTTLEIPSTVNREAINSKLFVSNVSSHEDVVRFVFNGFEHALPQVRDVAVDPSLKNPQHQCGDSTVRVVVEVDKKTYPCLVDICPFEGEGHEEQLPFLVIGNDLMSELEVTNNVPSE